jgi:FAD/FMN-containing dehydrogenase
LQEYFIPTDQFLIFAHALRDIAKQEKINLLNVTIRYVPKDTLSLLPYTKEDSFAFVLYVTQGLSEKEQMKAKQWTRQLINAALACRGTYYLPYQLYATKEQLQKAYPEIALLLEAKKLHDPHGLFSNTFFRTYFSDENSDF